MKLSANAFCCGRPSVMECQLAVARSMNSWTAGRLVLRRWLARLTREDFPACQALRVLAFNPQWLAAGCEDVQTGGATQHGVA